MALLRGVLVLAPHFDGFVALSAEQPAAAAVESEGKDAVFCSNGAGLRLAHYVLEVGA